jgi:protein-S-isoprenylcysteine O-methyltransferase Ste14
VRIQTSDLVFVVGFLVFVIIRGVFEQRTKGNVKVVSRRDGRELTVMAVLGVGTLVLPILYLFTPWLGFADYRLPAWASWCGTVLMSGALWLFWRSHADLGENWSVTLEVRQGHQLITHGVYRLVRHPMYAAIWLFSLAQGLLLRNWLAGWAALVSFVPMYFGRTPREEQMMCDVFGQAYRDYMRQTGRLLPRVNVRH